MSIFGRKPLMGNIPDEPVRESDNNVPERAEGKIFHLNKDKGYGFIASSDIPFERIYFYWTYLEQDTLRFLDLEKGMAVEFTPKLMEQGWRAIKIRVIDKTLKDHHDEEPIENE